MMRRKYCGRSRNSKTVNDNPIIPVIDSYRQTIDQLIIRNLAGQPAGGQSKILYIEHLGVGTTNTTKQGKHDESIEN